MDLINISESFIGEELVDTVDARELHSFLESKQEFSNWIKNRISQWGFVEGESFTVDKVVIGRATQFNYHISLDMAKELSMVERSDKGKEARKYFIECEKKLRESFTSVASVPELLPIEVAGRNFTTDKLIAMQFGLDENAALISANTSTRRETGFDFQKRLGIQLETPEQVIYFTPTEIGKEMGSKVSAQAVNKLLESAGLQSKVGGNWNPSYKGSKYSRVLDTGKRHSDGSMIQQVKWSVDVINLIQ